MKEITIMTLKEVKQVIARYLAIYTVVVSVCGMLDFALWRVWTEAYWIMSSEVFETLSEIFADWSLSCGIFCVFAMVVGLLVAPGYYMVCKLRSRDGVVIMPFPWND